MRHTLHRSKGFRKQLRQIAGLVGVAVPGLVLAALIEGDPEDNFLVGTPQADTINGKAGIDTMMGLGGNDTYIVAQSADEIIEGAGEGTDLVKSLASYTLPIFVENLILLGSSPINAVGNGLSNRLTGNPANIVLNGLGGADVMAGLEGNDTYFVGSADDEVIEEPNEGTDTVKSSITYKLGDNVESLLLLGTNAIN